MAKFNRRICDKCHVVFAPEIEGQTRCFRCAVEKVDRKQKDVYYLTLFPKEAQEFTCEVCGDQFTQKRSSTSRTCSEKCRSIKKYKKRDQSREEFYESERQRRIREANERWLLPKKPMKHAKSLETLNKMAEYKRVFDDRGWDHYNAGRKWDRI